MIDISIALMYRHGPVSPPTENTALIKAVARGHLWFEELVLSDA
jgi:hypothetical protein